MLRYRRKHFGNHDEGASAVEYGLLVAGIAVVIMLVVVTLGGTISGLFDKTSKCIASGTGAPCT